MITINDETMEKACADWGDMTNRNCHTENLQSKANFLWRFSREDKDKTCYRQFCTIFRAIADIQEEIGHLPMSLSQFRGEMMKEFYLAAELDLPEEQFNMLYQA